MLSHVATAEREKSQAKLINYWFSARYMNIHHYHLLDARMFYCTMFMYLPFSVCWNSQMAVTYLSF